MSRVTNTTILEKLDHLEELMHNTKTDIEVVKVQLKNISETIIRHESSIQKHDKFQTELGAKMTIIASAVSIIFSAVVGFLFKKLGNT